MPVSIKLIIFLIVSLYLIILSRKSLTDIKAHGFYRFWAWEFFLALVLYNLDRWFYRPFSPAQVISWLLLTGSVLVVIAGILALHKHGKATSRRQDDKLIGLEKTTQLVTSGIYRYIRHPLYASMFYGAWGVVFKDISPISIILAAAGTIMAMMTALAEEKENIAYFGDEYRKYMTRSKKFIPFIL